MDDILNSRIENGRQEAAEKPASILDNWEPHRCDVHHMRRLAGGGGKCIDCGYVEEPEWMR